ncbi:MAG: universal stress protein [Desulfotignum sp.]|nr:universal stress protein [Desulfotignum sp.]
MDILKILIAVDGSKNAERAIQYVADIIQGAVGFQIKLLSIEHLPDRDFFVDDTAWKEACVKSREKLLGFLADGRDLLIKSGISEKQVLTDYVESCHSPLAEAPDYCSRGTSVALDILHVAKTERFKTVVIGRRGISKAEEFMFGSVSNRIIHAGSGCTVWVVQ